MKCCDFLIITAFVWGTVKLLIATVCSLPEIDRCVSKIDHYILICKLLEKHPGRLCSLKQSFKLFPALFSMARFSHGWVSNASGLVRHLSAVLIEKLEMCPLHCYSSRLPRAGHIPVEERHRIRLQDPWRQWARRAGMVSFILWRFNNLKEKDTKVGWFWAPSPCFFKVTSVFLFIFPPFVVLSICVCLINSHRSYQFPFHVASVEKVFLCFLKYRSVTSLHFTKKKNDRYISELLQGD